MSIRRMLPFIVINVIVSAVVVLGILYWWDNRNGESGDVAQATVPPVTIPAAAPIADGAPVEAAVEAPVEAEEEGPLVHTVQAGDTLGNISRTYDVPMEDIIAANGIENPNILSVGQQLTIPVGGIATATPPPTETAAPDAVPPPIATEPAASGDVAASGDAVVEISDVIGAADLAAEAVQIVNSGSRQVALLGWTLSDQDGHTYSFDRVTLFGEGAGILVHTEAGQDGATDLYWGLEQPVWQAGEQVTLRDTEGNVQSTFTVP